jgi:hypothetical protein
VSLLIPDKHPDPEDDEEDHEGEEEEGEEEEGSDGSVVVGGPVSLATPEMLRPSGNCGGTGTGTATGGGGGSVGDAGGSCFQVVHASA